MKRTEGSLRDLWDNITIPAFELQESQKKKRKEYEKIFEEIILENSPNIEKEIVNQVQDVQSLIQNKPKEKQAKTGINQTNKD